MVSSVHDYGRRVDWLGCACAISVTMMMALTVAMSMAMAAPAPAARRGHNEILCAAMSVRGRCVVHLWVCVSIEGVMPLNWCVVVGRI